MRLPLRSSFHGVSLVLLLACDDAARVTQSPDHETSGGSSFAGLPNAGRNAGAFGGRSGGLGGATSTLGGSDNSTGGTRGPAGAPSTSGGSSTATGGSWSGGTPNTSFPERLSETGLYAPDGSTLREGIYPYTPRFELWSDGASKRRWIALPPGTKIDTTDPDFWIFPVGTKLWKEFSKDGIRVETRLVERASARDYRMVAYVWKPDQSDAVAAVDGQVRALGTDHDVPSASDCGTCHLNHPGRILGFSAVQLDFDSAELSLETLRREDRLSTAVPSAKGSNLDTLSMTALGTLHANCGTCHNPNSTIPSRGVELHLRVASLDAVTDTPFYRTTVGVAAGSDPDGLTPGILVTPGDPVGSALVHRMGSRSSFVAMPPLASKSVDVAGLAAVSDFISTLPHPSVRDQ